MTRTTAIAIAALAAAGFAAAMLALPHAASAWDVNSLPSNCGASAIYDTSGPAWYYRVHCDADSVMILYGTNQPPAAPTDPNFQANLDAFINAHYTAPVTTTAATTTASGTTTTTPATTTTTMTTTTTTTTTIFQPPTASFTATTSGLVVTLADTSTAVAPATITAASWTSSDGWSGAGSTVSHTFTAGGTFTINEIATDSNGLTGQTSQTITVSPFGGSAAFAETKSAKLATATTATFGHPLAVFCVKSWGNAKPERGYGLTIVGSHQANIWQRGCTALTTKRGPVALALLVLGHESAHALGIKSERTADCYGLKKIPLLEKRLRIVDHGYRATEARYVHKKWGRC